MGRRVKLVDWDIEADVVLMEESPNSFSMGGRCMHAGMSFLWIRGKFPAIITSGLEYIVILDLEGVIPIYSQAHETSARFGTFDLKLNAFREMCGMVIKADGFIQVDAPAIHNI